MTPDHRPGRNGVDYRPLWFGQIDPAQSRRRARPRERRCGPHRRGAARGLSDDALTRLRRDKIGFIFQFFNLLPTLSCLENVALPLHLRGWSRKKVHERASELLSLVRLADRLTHRPEELSGGQRQRVAIARALSIYPPILLADEPTGNLDSRTGEDILGPLHDLHSRIGSTVVIVTHDNAGGARAASARSLSVTGTSSTTRDTTHPGRMPRAAP